MDKFFGSTFYPIPKRDLPETDEKELDNTETETADAEPPRPYSAKPLPPPRKPILTREYVAERYAYVAFKRWGYRASCLVWMNNVKYPDCKDFCFLNNKFKTAPYVEEQLRMQRHFVPPCCEELPKTKLNEISYQNYLKDLANRPEIKRPERKYPVGARPMLPPGVKPEPSNKPPKEYIPEHINMFNKKYTGKK